MLAVEKYEKAYVDQCRKRVAADVRAFAAFAALASKASGAGEGGNALNQVRVLCNSLLLHDGCRPAL